MKRGCGNLQGSGKGETEMEALTSVRKRARKGSLEDVQVGQDRLVAGLIKSSPCLAS